jgi:hypothetical protein
MTSLSRLGPLTVALAVLWIPAGAFRLAAQSQPTFFEAFTDGQDAMRQGRWRQAVGDLERAVQLRPAPAHRVIIYGNNLLSDYYPYSLLARCHLELGQLGAAAALLSQAELMGEPASIREPIGRLLAAQSPPSAPAGNPPPQEARHPEGHPPGPDTTVASQSAPPAPAIQPAPATEARLLAIPSPTPSLVPNLAPSPGSPHLPPDPPVGPDQGKPSVADAVAAGAAPTGTAGRQESSQLRPDRRPEPAPMPRVPVPPPPASAGRQGPPVPRRVWLGMGGALALMAVWGGWARRGRKRSPTAEAALGAPPATIGPYRVLRLLGHGGFASTYLARHPDTGQEVAVKVLHPHRSQDPDLRRRFGLEAKLGELLDHPNLVRRVSPSDGETPTWIAFEYVPGPTLAAYLEAHAPLPLPEALGIALGVARAIAYAHARGVVHRDLKPANVILGPLGPKVTDLGIARDLDAASLTTTLSFLGTPRYAAPEAQMLTSAGPAADRYSLGVMLFEILTGRPPFQGETPFAIMDQHRSAPVPDLQAWRSVPPALARLVERLLEKRPELRPEDGELVTKLQDLLEAETEVHS